MYFVKLPFGEWVNLAQVRTVEVEESDDSLVPDINHLIVRLLFARGKSKAYCGGSFVGEGFLRKHFHVKAVAIMDALAETAYIDKSQISA